LENKENYKQAIKVICVLVGFGILIFLLPKQYFLNTLTVIVGIIWAIFITHKYAPNARLNLSYEMSPRCFVILNIEVENLSKVKIDKEHVKLQILKYSCAKAAIISEFVPFKRDEIIPGEEPIEWSDPIDILNTTKSIYPGERKHVERLFKIPSEAIIFHVGLQVKVSLRGFKGWISGIFNWDSMQRTTTIFILPQSSKRSAKTIKRDVKRNVLK